MNVLRGDHTATPIGVRLCSGCPEQPEILVTGGDDTQVTSFWSSWDVRDSAEVYDPRADVSGRRRPMRRS
jgi:hypothetical protein